MQRSCQGRTMKDTKCSEFSAVHKSVFIKEMGRGLIHFKCFVAKEVKMRQKDLTGR